ncbi:DNA-binding protein WhiA [Haploplasma axanthum]|nr:DNA-binding protein WhiA [Haploplasma axanthum]
MTFAKTVKNELITIPISHTEMLAEFSAFLNLGCEFHIENSQKMIDFLTKNPTVTKRFLLLTKTLYQSETILLKKDQQMFTKKPLIILRLTTQIDKIILEHGYLEDPIENARMITNTKEEKKAFLRGAFLVTGSINDPKTAEYHLEIFSNKKEEIIFIQWLMNDFNLNARITKRRNGYIAYLKDAESISDFIQLLGATNAVFKFEDSRIKRDFNNSINRIMNCEIANEKKSVIASQEQLNDIKLINKYYIGGELDLKTTQAIDLRKKYPEANLRELTEIFEKEYGETISKSGLNHRFGKIKKIADGIREGRKK